MSQNNILRHRCSCGVTNSDLRFSRCHHCWCRCCGTSLTGILPLNDRSTVFYFYRIVNDLCFEPPPIQVLGFKETRTFSRALFTSSFLTEISARSDSLRAGEENRTPVFSLATRRSTIELHLHLSSKRCYRESNPDLLRDREVCRNHYTIAPSVTPLRIELSSTA